MVNTNEQMNIAGVFLTGLSILPVFSPISLHPASSFMITLLLSFLGVTLFMNKGSKWIINILDQKEPLAIALGIATSSLAFKFMLMFPVAPGKEAMLVMAGLFSGLILIIMSLISRYTDFLDF